MRDRKGRREETRAKVSPGATLGELSADERRLVELWRAMDDRGRKYTAAVAESQIGWHRNGRLRLVP